MKKIKITLYTLLGLAMLFVGCEDGDTVFDSIVDAETRGAILRTVSVISNEIPIGSADSNFAVELEVQDQEEGTLVQSVEVWVGFRDNSVADGGTDFSADEVLAETLDASTFTTGEFGLPRFMYMITLPQLVAALPISDSTVDGSDQFTIRFELVLSDGSRYSFADNSGTLTGSFFSSPFLYTATVVCPPKAPTPGVWTVNMQDSYGDGWQPTTSGGGGPGLVITLSDGTVFEIGLCTPYEDPGYDCTDGASAGTATFTVPAGLTEAADFNFRGDFWGEMSFQLITPNGNTVADIPASTPAGSIAIDFCKD
ncbi:MAG: hypothetical protein HRT65_01565 [Flavobacteriaceae bacterium]|nr:hypothetical protein [Flavobacteriaceae bacterium]